jgi:hypothetical protein
MSAPACPAATRLRAAAAALKGNAPDVADVLRNLAPHEFRLVMATVNA